MIEGCYTGRKYMSDTQEELLQRLLPTLSAEDAETMGGIIKAFSVPKKGIRRVNK
jgi:hypothetical protein